MKNKIKKNIVNLTLILFLIISIVKFSEIFSYNDFGNIIKWYLILILMTITGFPLTQYFFNNYYDKGYIFSKTIGIIISGYTMWLFSSLHILKFNYINSLMCTLLIIIIEYIPIFLKNENLNNKKNKIRKILPIILRIEIIFLILFLYTCYIKGFNPSANSTEKFMDYGYMSIINKSDYMPPTDLWFSKTKINYYYFGQYISTFITKLARIKVSYGYNLMLITLFTITVLSSFSIIYNLFYLKNNKEKNKIIFYLGGLIGSLATTIAGNFHYVIYNLIIPTINKLNGINTNNYFFSNSTRYIGHNPATIDKTIHEFPSYSFILGDLHAHVINIIFVLLLIALLIEYINNTKKNKNYIEILFISILLGIYKMTNYWDFIIYIVVSVLIIVIFNIRKTQNKKNILEVTIKELLLIVIISSLISLPFMNKFHKMILGVKLVPYRTPLYQLIILWGLPTTLVIYFIIITIKNIKKIKKNTILEYLYQIDSRDLIIIVFGICALGLIIIPEIVYVVDIYLSSVRANTMFKLTYQSFIMYSLCFGYILAKLLFDKKLYNRITGYIILFLFILTLGYSKTAVKSWFGNICDSENYKTLDATKFLNNYKIINKIPDNYKKYINPNVTTKDDLKVINWLNKNTNNYDVILETYGESYTIYNRISTFTGLATPMGWKTHEWLWRTTNSVTEMPRIVAERIDDVEKIYTIKDINNLKLLISKYNISYIVIGYLERVRYTKQDKKLDNENYLNKLGTVVYKTNENNLKNATYVIKINKALIKKN